MPPRNKGVTLSLHEIQRLGGETAQQSLPSQSSGVERERPERADGEWRNDRSYDDGRRIEARNEEVDEDVDWRSSRTASSKPKDSGIRRADVDSFSRDGSAPSFPRPFDAGNIERRGKDVVDFGNVREAVRKPATTSFADRPVRTSVNTLSSTATGTAWGREHRAPGAEDRDDWRSGRSEAAKTRLRPSTAVGNIRIEEPVTRPTTETTKPSSEGPSPRRHMTSDTVEKSSNTEVTNASAPAASIMEKPAVKESVTILAPMILLKASSSAPRRPRIGGGTSRPDAVRELVKQKEAEAAAVQATVASKEPVDEVKASYRTVKQEREKKRREEEEKKKQEKELEEREQKLAMERLMTGDPMKMRKLQENIETALTEDADGCLLLCQLKSSLSSEDLESLIPSVVIAKCIVIKSILKLQSLSSSNDKTRMATVSGLVRILKPTLAFLFENSKIRHHKLKFLLETQRLIHGKLYYNQEMSLAATGFPRVSGGLALIEAVWDALYMEDIIQEQYFTMWYDSTDDETPGRNEALFQMVGWFSWLQNGSYEDDVQEDDDDDEDDEFDSQ